MKVWFFYLHINEYIDPGIFVGSNPEFISEKEDGYYTALYAIATNKKAKKEFIRYHDMSKFLTKKRECGNDEYAILIDEFNWAVLGSAKLSTKIIDNDIVRSESVEIMITSMEYDALNAFIEFDYDIRNLIDPVDSDLFDRGIISLNDEIQAILRDYYIIFAWLGSNSSEAMKGTCKEFDTQRMDFENSDALDLSYSTDELAVYIKLFQNILKM